MKRRIITLAAAVAILVLAGGTVAASERRDGGRAFTVVERAETDTVIDLGTPGDSMGDQLAFGNPIFNKANTMKVGRDEGFCVRTNPAPTSPDPAWECTWTTILDHGAITVQGPFYDDLRNSQLAITGGTGIYRNARGQMTLHARNAGGTEFDFIFRVIGG